MALTGLHAEITAFKTTGYKNSTLLREGKSGFPMERRAGTAAAGLLATKPSDRATCAYLELWPAHPGERVRAEGLWGQTHSNPTTELPMSPTATQACWSQHGKSWMATTTAWDRSELPGLAQSSVCCKLILSVVTCPYLHSGCPYSRAHTLDSCIPPGCCILQSGITLGQGSSA